mmetsp:Transcript_25653/g.65943  ORF Transcript_25653/g.65943 Transcript_25653/m.65943 type:complete len:208 (-) Transcript_25653:2049-2672(-)
MKASAVPKSSKIIASPGTSCLTMECPGSTIFDLSWLDKVVRKVREHDAINGRRMRRSRNFTSFRAAQTVSNISRSSGNSSRVETRSSRDAMAQMHTVLQRIVAFLLLSTPNAAISPTTVAACRSITCCPPCSTETLPRDNTYISVPVSPWRMIVSSGMKVLVVIRSASVSQKALWHFSNSGKVWSFTVLTSSRRSCTHRSKRCCSPG